jgi:hypothetical protein
MTRLHAVLGALLCGGLYPQHNTLQRLMPACGTRMVTPPPLQQPQQQGCRGGSCLQWWSCRLVLSSSGSTLMRQG